MAIYNLFSSEVDYSKKEIWDLRHQISAEKTPLPSAQKDYIKYVSIFPDKLVTYTRCSDFSRTRNPLPADDQKKVDRRLSKKASKRLSLALSWMSHLAKSKLVNDDRLKRNFKFKLNFITLTLPCLQVESILDDHNNIVPRTEWSEIWPLVNYGYYQANYYYTDDYIKSNLLNQFITELRHNFKVQFYVWRAETQANGNIHFHFTFDKYIFHEELRSVWNRLLNKTDMIDRYQQEWSGLSLEQYMQKADPKHNKSFKKLSRAYNYGQRSQWRSPNSTDIHSVKHIGNVVGYLSGYYCKNDEFRRYVDGYIWRLSNKLSEFKQVITCESTCIANELDYLYKCFKSKFHAHDYCSVFFINIRDVFNSIENSMIVNLFTNYKNNILGINPIPI